MPTFHEAANRVIETGKTDALDEFLSTASAAEAAKPFLSGHWPSFNGIIAQTPIAHRVLTAEALKEIDQETLNKTLTGAIRNVCFEGNSSQGFEVLDRLVEAGARTDVMKRPSGASLVESNPEAANEITIKTGNNPPRIDEVLSTPDEIRDYVDRLVAADAAVYGDTISRDGSLKESQWARSVASNPLVSNSHEALRSPRSEKGQPYQRGK